MEESVLAEWNGVVVDLARLGDRDKNGKPLWRLIFPELR